jgi:hypothetical protein
MKPASCRISFQGVHTTTDTANDILVRGAQLEFEARFVERLQQFVGALEEERA